MDDLISRQNTLLAFEKCYNQCCREDEVGDKWIHYETALNEIESIPSAQPEIIVCDDCKWRISENRKNTSLWLPCRAIVTPDQFSCIYAERREVAE